jgi:Protein of unknown function (DUF1559)
MPDEPTPSSSSWLRIGIGVLGTALGLALAIAAAGWVMDQSDRRDPRLGQLAQALRAHNDQHGRLPPAFAYGPDGLPLLSWRVLVLPSLGQNELFNEFHLDEAWDSPHNLALLPRMPDIYAPPRWKRSKVPAYHTVCHVFVGKGAAFEGTEGLRVPADFPDGSFNTFLVVEAGKPVPWTKPEDLPYDPEGPLPDLRGLFRDGFRAASAGDEGWVTFIKAGESEKKIREWIVRYDGDGPSSDW